MATTTSVHDLSRFGLVADTDPDRSQPIRDAVSLNSQPSFTAIQDLIFVCVDIKKDCMEGRISEIGIAMLDSRHIKDIAPGDRGVNWHKNIRTKHVQVQEHLHYREGRHLGACTETEQKCDIFAYSMSRINTLERGKQFILDLLTKARGRASPRDFILIVWGQAMATAIQELELDVLDARLEIFDVQDTIAALAVKFSRGGLENDLAYGDFARALGQHTTLQEIELLHNAGNDATFKLQSFVSTALLTEIQLFQLASKGVIDKPIEGGGYGVHLSHIRKNQVQALQVFERLRADPSLASQPLPAHQGGSKFGSW